VATADDRIYRERDLYRGLLELGTHDDPDAFLRSALKVLRELTSARRIYVELRDDEAPPVTWWAAEGFDAAQLDVVRSTLSSGIIGESLATGNTVVTASAIEDPRFCELASVKEQEIESVLCVPIIRDLPFGVVYLQGDRSTNRFSPFDTETRKNVEYLARAVAPLGDRLIERTRRGLAPRPLLARPKGFEHVLGASPIMAEVINRLALAAKLDIHILFTGASGAGKTMLARSVHVASPRADRPFIDLNCAAIPETLFENELFGAAGGAHSGVPRTGLVGKVEAANGGTLFLDEVAELSLGSQAKLLQLLQDKIYYRLGSAEVRRADVRIIAATNRDLATQVRERTFREDLYYRLRVFEARVPSLAERREDLILLANQFCLQACKTHGFGAKLLSPSGRSAVMTAEWPGNVRELANRLESAILNAHLRSSDEVNARDMFPETPGNSHEEVISLQGATRHFQRSHLLAVLEAADWNMSDAARRLDIARSHLYNLIRAHGLARLHPKPERRTAE
jgi:Nif-specific regulatory protein